MGSQGVRRDISWRALPCGFLATIKKNLDGKQGQCCGFNAGFVVGWGGRGIDPRPANKKVPTGSPPQTLTPQKFHFMHCNHTIASGVVAPPPAGVTEQFLALDMQSLGHWQPPREGLVSFQSDRIVFDPDHLGGWATPFSLRAASPKRTMQFQ